MSDDSTKLIKCRLCGGRKNGCMACGYSGKQRIWKEYAVYPFRPDGQYQNEKAIVLRKTERGAYDWLDRMRATLPPHPRGYVVRGWVGYTVASPEDRA